MVTFGHTAAVGNPKSDVRVRALQHVIQTRWAGNASAFARDSGKSQSQIADMIGGRKAFGEKVARSIETKAGLELGLLDREPGVSEPVVVYGQTLSPEAVEVGREWSKLPEELREQISVLIHVLVATHRRDGAKASRHSEKTRESRQKQA
jgi:hypothetical protein